MTDDLTDRLSALGRQPLDPALQSEHLTQMAGVAPGGALRRSLASKAKLGAAVVAGFLIGTTGLATAGAMGPLQNISADVVQATTPLNPPRHGNDTSDAAKAKASDKTDKADDSADSTGSDSTDAKTPKYWTGCDAIVPGYDTTAAGANRGRFLQAAKAVDDTGATFEKARQSDCGKAIAASTAPNGTEDSADTSGDSHGKSGDHKPSTAGDSSTKGDTNSQDGKGGDSADHTSAITTGSQPAATPNSDKADDSAPSHSPADSGHDSGDAGTTSGS